MAGGRRRNLTDAQLSEAWARHLSGESLESIAQSLGSSKSALSKAFAGRKTELQAIANEIVEADKKLKALPILEQKAVENFASILTDISFHLGHSAKYGARSSHRLSYIANLQAEKIDDADPMSTATNVQAFAVLNEQANEAAKTGINLIKANQAAVERINKDNEQPPAPKQIVFNVADGKKPNADA